MTLSANQFSQLIRSIQLIRAIQAKAHFAFTHIWTFLAQIRALPAERRVTVELHPGRGAGQLRQVEQQRQQKQRQHLRCPLREQHAAADNVAPTIGTGIRIRICLFLFCLSANWALGLETRALFAALWLGHCDAVSNGCRAADPFLADKAPYTKYIHKYSYMRMCMHAYYTVFM